MASIVPILTLVQSLSSIDRFTMEKLHSRESVLEHVGMVALITMALATEVVGRDEKFDVYMIHDALSRALCHDVDEIITGDVARPTKYSSTKSIRMFHELSDEAIEKVKRTLHAGGFEHFGRAARYAFGVAKYDDSAGTLVALADILAVVAKVREEVLIRGNRGMVRQAHTCLRQLQAFRERIARVYSGESANFLRAVLESAVEIMNQAIAVDCPDLQVEEY